MNQIPDQTSTPQQVASTSPSNSPPPNNTNPPNLLLGHPIQTRWHLAIVFSNIVAVFIQASVVLWPVLYTNSDVLLQVPTVISTDSIRIRGNPSITANTLSPLAYEKLLMEPYSLRAYYQLRNERLRIHTYQQLILLSFGLTIILMCLTMGSRLIAELTLLSLNKNINRSEFRQQSILGQDKRYAYRLLIVGLAVGAVTMLAPLFIPIGSEPSYSSPYSYIQHPVAPVDSIKFGKKQ